MAGKNPVSNRTPGGPGVGDGGSEYEYIDERAIDQMVLKAADAAARGENIEQVQEVLISTLPAAAREKARKKLATVLKKRNMRQPTGDADIPSRATLARLRNVFALSAQQAMERIMQLAKSHPDIAARIEQAGKVLMRNGVRADKIRLTDADLGSMAPVISGPATEQTSGRGI